MTKMTVKSGIALGLLLTVSGAILAGCAEDPDPKVELAPPGMKPHGVMGAGGGGPAKAPPTTPPPSTPAPTK